MNIIFGEAVNTIPDNYTTLELDTVRIEGTDTKTTFYCLVENIPLEEFPLLENNKENHAMLMENYKNQNWDYCAKLIPFLLGKFSGELDSFYDIILGRILSSGQ